MSSFLHVTDSIVTLLIDKKLNSQGRIQDYLKEMMIFKFLLKCFVLHEVHINSTKDKGKM